MSISTMSQRAAFLPHSNKWITNGPTRNNNSGYNSEEKERQKQEARAQREMNGRITDPEPEPNEAVFSLVPNAYSDSDRVSKVLGDYYTLVRSGNANKYIGIDEQPATPAPTNHIHDPDTFKFNHIPPPPSLTSSRSSSSSDNFTQHQPNHHSSVNGSSGRSKPTNHRQPASSSSLHHGKSSDETKRTHKSGPGPGSGSINNSNSISSRSHNNERISNNRNPPSNNDGPTSTNSSVNPQKSSSKAPHLKVHQILKEVKSFIIDPSPDDLGPLDTPRPDHYQSSFTSPHSAPDNNHNIFRVPLDPDVKGRASSDHVKIAKTSAVESIINNGSELGLSDDSEDEVSSPSNPKENESVQKTADMETRSIGTSHLKNNKKNKELNHSKLNGEIDQNFRCNPSKISNCLTNCKQNLRNESIVENTSESVAKLESTRTKGPYSVVLNLSDDLAMSSDSDNEVNKIKQTTSAVNSRLNTPNNPNETYVKPMPPTSSFGEGVKLPMSPMAKSTDDSTSESESDTGTSSDSDSDEDKKSPVQPDWRLDKLFNKSASPVYDDVCTKKDTNDFSNKPPSPRHPNEVAPPIVAAVPKHRKRSAVDERLNGKPLSNLCSDESSDEEQQQQQIRRAPPRVQKVAGSRYQSAHKLPKVKHVAPTLSSDSDDYISPPHPPVPTRKPSTPKLSNAKSSSQSQSTKSPRGGVTAPTSKHKKKPEGKRKEIEKMIKSKEYLTSDVDSDSDQVSASSYSKSRNKVSSMLADRPSNNVHHSPKQKVAPVVDNRKESYNKATNRPKTNSEIKIEVSLPISREQMENLKPQKDEKPEKKRKSRSDKENVNESKNATVPDSVHSRLEPPPPSAVRGSPIQKNSQAGHVQYENGVPKLMCSIPFSLIDYVPGLKAEDRVNKEVLEMRTSGGGAKKKINNNEDNKKLAISTIYNKYKRPSSLEPDKIKRDSKLDESAKNKSEDNLPSKTEVKFEEKMKLEVPTIAESNLIRQGSNSSLSSSVTQEVSTNHKAKKHKKDKRKDRSFSKDNSKELNYESDKGNELKKRQSTPEVDLLNKKRNRDIRHEESSGGENSSHRTKKTKLSPPVTTDNQSPSNLASEERPSSSMSGEHFSRRSKKSSQLLESKTYESEEDPSPTQDSSQLKNKQTTGDEAAAGTSGSPPEFNYIPSSDVESRNGGGSSYRPGPSPIPTEGGTDMYPPNAHTEYNAYNSNNSQQSYESVGSRQSTLCYSRTWGDRKAPDVGKDHGIYMKNAIDLKHKADSEHHNRTLQTAMYLEAVLNFILTGEAMGTDHAAYKMFNDTIALIRHVSQRQPVFRRDMSEEPNVINIILVILSLRCQSLLYLKSYSMRRIDCRKSYEFFTEYSKHYEKTVSQASTPCSGSATVAVTGGVGTPSHPNGWSQRSAGANNSPSSLSPTPSPAGSVGSEGSQSSSGYSTEGARQQRGGGQAGPSSGLTTPPHPTVGVPVDIHASVIKYYSISHSLSQAFDMWNEADDYVQRSDDIKDFFVKLNKHMGSLTIHSSLRELVPYVQEALNHLKWMISQNQPEVTCSTTKAPSGVK